MRPGSRRITASRTGLGVRPQCLSTHSRACRDAGCGSARNDRMRVAALMTQCQFKTAGGASVFDSCGFNLKNPVTGLSPGTTRPTLDRVQRRLGRKVSGRPLVFRPRGGCVAQRAHPLSKQLSWLGAHGLPGRASRYWITEATRKHSRLECTSPRLRKGATQCIRPH
jgi:hypothetical protein